MGPFSYLSTSRIQIINDWKKVAVVSLYVCMVLIMASDNRLTRQVIEVQEGYRYSMRVCDIFKKQNEMCIGLLADISEWLDFPKRELREKYRLGGYWC